MNAWTNDTNPSKNNIELVNNILVLKNTHNSHLNSCLKCFCLGRQHTTYNMIPTLDPVVKPPHDQVQRSIGYPPVARVFLVQSQNLVLPCWKVWRLNKKRGKTGRKRIYSQTLRGENRDCIVICLIRQYSNRILKTQKKNPSSLRCAALRYQLLPTGFLFASAGFKTTIFNFAWQCCLYVFPTRPLSEWPSFFGEKRNATRIINSMKSWLEGSFYWLFIIPI